MVNFISYTNLTLVVFFPNYIHTLHLNSAFIRNCQEMAYKKWQPFETAQYVTLKLISNNSL